ncbi:hypothetical protein F4803DRAFT_574661 [Xylaria telfairii]|nr:hypothetical protein F4803DRAFT_574661 [Xylaria telfairii]
MANSVNRSEVLAAIDFVESHFPNSQAPGPTLPRRAHDPPHLQQPHQKASPMSPPGVPAKEYYSSVPDHPPPGLVRIDPPSPAPFRVITNETASLFGDFARYLDNGVDEDGNPVAVDLTCSICLESKLIVSDHVTPNRIGHAPRAFEAMAVMPCGHYFGTNCLYEWLVSSHWNASCPLCRFQLLYECGHELEPREYNPLGTRRMQIPMTVPEGGKIPRSCCICYEDCIETAIDRLRSLLFPRDVVPGDLQFADSDQILRSMSAQFKNRVWNSLILNEHYIRW